LAVKLSTSHTSSPLPFRGSVDPRAIELHVNYKKWYSVPFLILKIFFKVNITLVDYTQLKRLLQMLTTPLLPIHIVLTSAVTTVTGYNLDDSGVRV
jgi:hypothetical protein